MSFIHGALQLPVKRLLRGEHKYKLSFYCGVTSELHSCHVVEFLVVRAIILTLSLDWVLNQDKSHTGHMSEPYQHCFDNPSWVSISHCTSSILFPWFLTLTSCLYWGLHSGIHWRIWEGLGGNRPNCPQWQNTAVLQCCCDEYSVLQVGCILRIICAESISSSEHLETNTQFKNRLGDGDTYRKRGLPQAVPGALFL